MKTIYVSLLFLLLSTITYANAIVPFVPWNLEKIDTYLKSDSTDSMYLSTTKKYLNDTTNDTISIKHYYRGQHSGRKSLYTTNGEFIKNIYYSVTVTSGNNRHVEYYNLPKLPISVVTFHIHTRGHWSYNHYISAKNTIGIDSTFYNNRGDITKILELRAKTSPPYSYDTLPYSYEYNSDSTIKQVIAIHTSNPDKDFKKVFSYDTVGIYSRVTMERSYSYRWLPETPWSLPESTIVTTFIANDTTTEIYNYEKELTSKTRRLYSENKVTLFEYDSTGLVTIKKTETYLNSNKTIKEIYNYKIETGITTLTSQQIYIYRKDDATKIATSSNRIFKTAPYSFSFSRNRLTIKNRNNRVSTGLIIDMRGRVIKRISLTNTTTVDISNFPKGIYLFQIKSDIGYYKSYKFRR